MQNRSGFRHTLKTLSTATLLASLSACIHQGGETNGDTPPRESQGTSVSVADQPVVDQPTTVSGGAAAACESFKRANATITTKVDPGCTACRVENASAAADDDLASHADLVVNDAAPTQGLSLRATAQPGVIFAAGRVAGIFYSSPAGTTQNTSVVINTLSGGVLQETSSNSNMSGIGGGRSKSFAGIRTSKPFDAVEVFINNSQVETDPRFQIFEICSDHH